MLVFFFLSQLSTSLISSFFLNMDAFPETAVLLKFPKDNEGYYNFEAKQYFTLFCTFDGVFLDL